MGEDPAIALGLEKLLNDKKKTKLKENEKEVIAKFMNDNYLTIQDKLRNKTITTQEALKKEFKDFKYKILKHKWDVDIKIIKGFYGVFCAYQKPKAKWAVNTII